MASAVSEEIYGYDERRFGKEIDENFHCYICYNVLKEPRMCRDNEHIFCLACITRSLELDCQSCPECGEDLTVDTLRLAPRVVNNYLAGLKIKCDYASRGCPQFVRLESLNTHVENCGFAPVLCSNEECGMEINKQDKAHHESAICEYRKLKCHNCREMQESLTRLEGSLGKINKTIDQKEEALKKSIKQEFNKQLEVLKKEMNHVKDDVTELKVMMGQVLETLNKLQLTDKPSSTSERVPKETSKENLGYVRQESFPKPLAASTPYPGQMGQPTRTQGFVRKNLLPLTPAILAQASAADQKYMLRERLFSIIQQTHPSVASKVTGMLLELDNGELLHMLESHEALAAKVKEVVSVLQAFQAKEAIQAKVKKEFLKG